MLRNKKLDAKILKYKKIYIYPKNTHFKKEDNIISYKINNNSKLKHNLSNLLLDNINLSNKNKSFLNYYINPKILSCQNIKDKAKNILSHDNNNNIDSGRRNFSLKNKNGLIDKYEEILEELRYIKQNNKSININININNNYKNNKKRSKSINIISSKKNTFNNKDININKNILNFQDKNNDNENDILNNISDLLNNNKIKENRILTEKYNKNIKNSKKYLSIKNNKIKNFINEINQNFEEKKFLTQKVKIRKKSQKIKSKIININNIIKERSKSTPKMSNSNLVSDTFGNNNSKINYIINTEDKKRINHYINIKDDILNNNKINFNKINYYTLGNNDYSVNYNKNNTSYQNDNNREQDSFIIKERYLYKNNNKDNNNNRNIPLFNKETDNQIQNWINKEKNVSDYNINKEKNKNLLFFDNINNINNKEFHNYQISNKYFNNNQILVNNKSNYKKPIKSIILFKGVISFRFKGLKMHSTGPDLYQVKFKIFKFFK